MTGLFERALGEAWTDLHPRLRDRYGVRAEDDRIVVGRGVMERLDSHALLAPAFWLAAFDDALFPEGGTDVPFEIETDAFVDAAGEEALVLRRRFDLARPRTFVDTLRWDPERERLIEFVGRSGRLVSELHLDATDEGALALSFGAQWLRVGGRYVPIPGPLAAEGELRDWYDDDAERFEVAAAIRAPVLGEAFGYRGHFANEVRPADAVGEDSSRPPLGSVRLPGGRR